MGTTMAGTDLKSIVDRIIDLPTLPQVVQKIVGLLDDPASSVKQINEVMSQDPALVAKILKVVNSAFYGLPNRVSSIQQAIVILGFNTVKSLAISASVLDMFGSGEEHFSYEKFWAHSIGTATVAEILADREPMVDRDTAFVGGLMHDMGKLVLDQYASAEFQEILAIAREREIGFAEAEAEVLETSHAEIGYWLAQKWQLEDILANAIRHQHDVADAPDEPSRKLAAVVAFADHIVRLRQYGESGSYGRPALPVAAWEALSIEKDTLPALMKTITAQMHRADEFLAVLES